MKLRRVVVVAVVVMVSAWLRPAGAASPEADAKAFVQKFYDTYMPVVQAEKDAPASNYVVEKMSAVLDRSSWRASRRTWRLRPMPPRAMRWASISIPSSTPRIPPIVTR
jgi:hypothetical protein